MSPHYSSEIQENPPRQASHFNRADQSFEGYQNSNDSTNEASDVVDFQLIIEQNTLYTMLYTRRPGSLATCCRLARPAWITPPHQRGRGATEQQKPRLKLKATAKAMKYALRRSVPADQNRGSCLISALVAPKTSSRRQSATSPLAYRDDDGLV